MCAFKEMLMNNVPILAALPDSCNTASQAFILGKMLAVPNVYKHVLHLLYLVAGTVSLAPKG